MESTKRAERDSRGDVRPWVLELGGVQRHGCAVLSREHGAYVVRALDPLTGRHRVEGFRRLGQARRCLKTFGAGML